MHGFMQQTNHLARKNLLEFVGNTTQLAGMKEYELTSGRGRGVRCIDVWTGTGFQITVLPDRSLDICAATFRGLSLCWHSPSGVSSPFFYESQGRGWTRNFFGGLLTTCGLTQVGNPCMDGGEELGLHGRVSNTPASNVCLREQWSEDDCAMSIEGVVRESRLHGENVTMTRTISTRLGTSKLSIVDVVQNAGYRTVPHMILYHVNIGYPLLEPGSELLARFTSCKQIGETSDQEGSENFSMITNPERDYKPRLYDICMEANNRGEVLTVVLNRKYVEGGIGLYLKYNKGDLDQFTLWKLLRAGEYVIGLEPGNCSIEGRTIEREKGRLKYLEPGEKRRYELEIGVLEAIDNVSSLADVSMVLQNKGTSK